MSSIVDAAFFAASAIVLAIARVRAKGRDSGQWLENITDPSALKWVEDRNAKTLALFGDPLKSPLYSKILAILDPKDKIPYVRQVGRTMLYNFWRDDNHVKGILRRTNMYSYAKSEPEWEIVLDLDELAKEEEENWV